MSLNQKVADQLYQIGEILAIKGDRFRSRAYNMAAQRVTALTEDIGAIAERGELEEIPGVGKSIAMVIEEIIETGLTGVLLDLRDSLPKGVLQMIEVEGIGPKIAMRLSEELGITNIEMLEQAAKEEKIRELKGFGPKKEENILKAIDEYRNRSTVVLENMLQVDLRVIPPESYGAALQYFTGSKEHNVKLRTIGVKAGYKLNEYGLYRREDDSLVEAEDEAKIYEALGMRWMPPELRENTGEIEAAIEDKLPELVTLDDIRGDLHVHTDYSHAIDPLEEMVEKAVKMGHQYMAITDHSQSLAIAQGLSEEKLMQQIEEIRRLDEEYSEIKLLAGTECDIKSDGSLDYNDEVLEQLDWVVASIHTGMQQDEATITNRIVEAIKNPYTRVIGHPTGRLIQRRNPYPVDLDTIFKAAAEEKVFMEINCSPSRLDLRDVDARRAKEADVKLVLGSDAHSVSQLEFLPLGVAVARRGWLGVDDVVNTWSLDKAQGYRK